MAEPCVKEDGGMKNKLSDSIGQETLLAKAEEQVDGNSRE